MRLEDRPEPTPSPTSCWCRRSALASAAPIARSSPAATAGRPPDSERLVLGHESLGRVLQAPHGQRLCRPAIMVVGIVRRRDPRALRRRARRRVGHVPQRPLRRARHQALRWLRRRALPPRARLRSQGRPGAWARCGVLLEPASVLAKAWDHIDRIGQRTRSWSAADARWSPARGPSACWRRSWPRSAASISTCSIAPRTGRSRSWCGHSAAPITSIDLPDDLRRRHRARMHRRAAARDRDVLMRRRRPQRHRLPDRRVQRRPHPALRLRALQPRRTVLRQRSSSSDRSTPTGALRDGRRRARQQADRAWLAATAHAGACRCRIGARRSRTPPDDIKVIVRIRAEAAT